MNPALRLKRNLLFLLLLALILPELRGEVRLPRVLGSHMVIQREQPVKIWGWADPGEQVSVTIHGQTVASMTDTEGKWVVSLAPMQAGGPYEMEIRGKDSLLLEDILVGDVWICSGQSNMEWSVSDAKDAGKEIVRADHPGIRLFTVPNNAQPAPVDDIPTGAWKACSPKTVGNFSAVGYFFGRYIHREENVSVGLISSNWGGTDIETWTSGEMAATDPVMNAALKEVEGMDIDAMKAKAEQEKKALLESLGALGAGIVDGKVLWAEEELDLGDWSIMEVPGLWEDRGLPGVDGIVWFRRTMELTEAQAAAGAVLYLGPIDDGDRTWINGMQVGSMVSAYNKDREYRVGPGILKPGTNTLVVRVEDTGGGGGFHGKAGEMKLETVWGDIPLAGEWHFRVSSESFELASGLGIDPNSSPTLLYNGMIHPLVRYAVRGVVWYQGENNTWEAYRYRTLFPNMIGDWRKHWGNPDMGFYFVQLANHKEAVEQPAESDWAELREAQAMALSLPHTGMAVTIDIGDADDIHPLNKQDVGLRLALAALHDSYGRDLVYSGPVYRSMTVENSTVLVELDPMGSPLVVRDKYGYVKGFALAGEDRVYHWARGMLEGKGIRLESGEVKAPVAVRYAWGDNPDDANLYNAAGLPAGPFRTDDWPGITYGQ